MSLLAELDLPADLLAAVRALDGVVEDDAPAEDAQRQDQLTRIGQILCREKDSAVNARRQSGIETIWQRCEEHFNSIDGANRHEFGNAQWAKPLTMDGTVSTEDSQPSKGRSTAFPPVTSRYVNVAHAKVTEILLPPDEKAFSFSPTPVPELVEAKEDTTPLTHPETGQPLERDTRPDEVAPQSGAGLPGMPMSGPDGPPQPLTVKDLAEEVEEQASTASEKAEKRVYDWMIEGGYRPEARKSLLDAAKLGTLVLKGPYPKIKRRMAATKVQGPDGAEVVKVKIVEKVVPAFKRISLWDFYPDRNCGENPADGNWIWERDRMSERSLRRLMKEPGYLKSQITLVIEQGPMKKYVESGRPSDLIDSEQYEVWHGQGVLSREDYLCINPPSNENPAPDEDVQAVPIIATIINDVVIKAVFHPLEVSGDFNYHVMPWQRRDGYWAGVGVAEQVFTAQRIVKSATRAMLDNAGYAAGPQVIIDTGCISPPEGQAWELKPWKIWFKGSSTTIDDVRKAFTVIEFPDRQAALLAIIEYGFRLAEESTNIPLIAQGQSGNTTPDTFGATDLQNTNANQLLRSIAENYDECVTQPLVNQCYEWLLLDTDIPADEKGDMDINAQGSSALAERAIQRQTIAQLGPLNLNPAYGGDPKRWYKELLRSLRFNPAKFCYSKAEQDKIDSTPPPSPPQVEVAKIRAEVDQMKMQLQQQMKDAELQLKQALGQQDKDRDTVYVQAETERTRNAHQARMVELNLKRELAMLDYANKRELTLEQVKADLAMNTQKLMMQRELAQHDTPGETTSPPTEPPGKAPDGQSFEK